MERETFTSTKLQLHLYTDAQCSKPFDDGESSKKHARKGYQIGDTTISTQVSFKVPFYSCMSCAPDEVSGTFNKRNGNWYDDDYISTYGMKQGDYGGDQGDDKYMASNDDVGNYVDDRYNRKLVTASDLAPKVSLPLRLITSPPQNQDTCLTCIPYLNTGLRRRFLARIRRDEKTL